MTIEKAQQELELAQRKQPVTVEFTVKDDFEKSLPSILSNISEIKAWAEERTEIDRRTILVTDEDYTLAKQRCADINKIIKNINDRKIDIKKKYIKPYEVFESAIKDTIEVLETARENLWGQVKSAEEQRKTERMEKMREYWEETLDSTITSYRTFESIYNPKWVNKTTDYKQAFTDMDKLYQAIEMDVAYIQTFDGKHVVSLLEYYKDNHTLKDTIEYSKRLQDREKALKAENNESQRLIQNAEENRPQDELPPQNEQFEIIFKVIGTKEQIKALKDFMNDNGIKYGRA